MHVEKEKEKQKAIDQNLKRKHPFGGGSIHSQYHNSAYINMTQHSIGVCVVIVFFVCGDSAISIQLHAHFND